MIVPRRPVDADVLLYCDPDNGYTRCYLRAMAVVEAAELRMIAAELLNIADEIDDTAKR